MKAAVIVLYLLWSGTFLWAWCLLDALGRVRAQRDHLLSSIRCVAGVAAAEAARARAARVERSR